MVILFVLLAHSQADNDTSFEVENLKEAVQNKTRDCETAVNLAKYSFKESIQQAARQHELELEKIANLHAIELLKLQLEHIKDLGRERLECEVRKSRAEKQSYEDKLAFYKNATKTN